jgi:signal recognition particle receptor subunit beta
MNLTTIFSDPAAVVAQASVIELVVTLVVVVLVTIVLLQTLTSKGAKGFSGRSRGDIALIIGPCASGKTTLFYKWSLPDQKIKTVTSQAPMRGKILRDCPLEVVDYPGHPRLRHGVNSLLPRSQRIVFLIDATNEDYKSMSEQLYDLLVARDLRHDAKLLICLNKTESPKAKSESAVVNAINQEIEKLRHARSQQLDADSAETDQYLGVSDEPFDIKAHCPVDVEFGSVSVLKGKIDVIESFLVR